MRAAGIDRGVFFNEVWLPLLKKIGLTRHDLPFLKTNPAGAEAGASRRR